MSSSVQGASWRVLVVEDDPIIGMMLRDMLRELKCEPVGPAGSVTAALKLLETTLALDAAVLDCNLGGEKVWPVADRLVARKLPFVFSTGYGQAGIEPRFKGIPVLNKPFPVKQLRSALLPLLAR
jgi:CheY-like chemotaxis protein